MVDMVNVGEIQSKSCLFLIIEQDGLGRAELRKLDFVRFIAHI